MKPIHTSGQSKKRASVPSYQARLERLERLVGLVSTPGTGPSACMSTSQLLELMDGFYGDKNRQARQRLLQMDLKTLCGEGRIEQANPGGKPLRYRRCAADAQEAQGQWQRALHDIRDLVAEVGKEATLTRLFESLLYHEHGPLLDAKRLRVIPDTLRLQPAQLYPHVLMNVLNALVYGCALQVSYRNAKGDYSRPLLHPQALVLRGPIPYLLALKNDEDEPVRFYALHRMIDAVLATDIQARQAEDFDLDEALEDGMLDFGQGEWIDLELRVRGYLAEVLEICPLEPDQTIEVEDDGSEFDILVKATVPSTGQLARWILGAAPNIEVLAPESLRADLAARVHKLAALYAMEVS